MTDGHSRSRRVFLTQISAVAGSAFFMKWRSTAGASVVQGVPDLKETDERICGKKFKLGEDHQLSQRPIGGVMIAVGTSFLGTPYKARTLEQPGDEQLVVNLRELDCVTFVENTLALSRCVKLERTSFEEYRSQLRYIRYRGGNIDGYPSRLHYFSDWIHDNEAKGIVRDVSKELGGEPYLKTVNFMSTHPSSYRQLTDRLFFDAITQTERQINSRSLYYVPKEKLRPATKGIQEGDIIGITTSVEGLDVAHTGMAIRQDGVLKYLHAPLSDGVVQVTEQSLEEYLTARTKHTGIMIARPLEPAL